MQGTSSRPAAPTGREDKNCLSFALQSFHRASTKESVLGRADAYVSLRRLEAKEAVVYGTDIETWPPAS